MVQKTKIIGNNRKLTISSLRSGTFLILCSLLSQCTAAQEAPFIRNFFPDDYQAQNQNWDLVQDTFSKHLYVANNAGVLAFDGARWQLFPLPENQTVRAVATGKNGEIFCGGFAEFGFWKAGADGRMAYHSLREGVQSAQIDKEEIWHILALEDCVLFQSFSTIYKYDYQKVTVLQPPGLIMFLRKVGNRVLVPGINQGLYELSTDGVFRLLAGTNNLSGKTLQFLLDDGGGGILIGTANHGLFVLKGPVCKPWNHPLNAAFQRFQLNRAMRLRDGAWALGTILNGVYVLEHDGRLRYHLNRESGLQNNTVLAFAEDHDGNLWIGLDRGIALAALQTPLSILAGQSGKIGAVYSAAFWNERLYVGTNQGVFVRENGAFNLIPGTQGQVWQLKVFGNRLICGHNAGTFQITQNGATKISDITGGWCTLAVPGQPQLLIQSAYTGLVAFKQDAAGNWRPAHRIEGISEPFRRIEFDENGQLWAAHPNKGLYRLSLNPEFTQIQSFKSFGRHDGLPSDYQVDIVRIGQQIVVNTQYYPLLVIDSVGQSRLTPLLGPAIRQKRLAGEQGDYFIVDSSGIALYQGSNLLIKFDLPLIRNFENIIALNEHEYLICMENGLAKLDKRRLPPAGSPVREQCRIRFIRSGEGHHFIPEPELVLRYADNSLVFYFSTTEYQHPPLFSWKLKGFSDRWSPWQRSAEKEFTRLSPGRYVLYVRSAGGAETSQAFRILPPWYRSSWAWAMYVLFAIAGLYWVEQLNLRRLRRQRMKLEAQNTEALLQQRHTAERELLAIEVETKNRELSNAALNLIRKNEALQHLRDELEQSNNEPGALQKLARAIDRHLESDHDWEIFEASFNRVHDDFFKRLLATYPELTPGDLRLAAYLKMNLSSKEIAPLLNISLRGVENKRYRLRKKIGLPEDANLTEFFLAY